MLSSPDPSLQSLRLLAVLRTFAPVAQALTILFATHHQGMHLPLAPIAALLALEVLIALATWMRVRNPRPVSAIELFVQVNLDIVMLTLMLYFTGGTANPFAPMYLLPLAIAATSLKPGMVWIIGLTTVACYAGLKYFHVPMSHPNGYTEVYELHENGMVANYIFTAALVTFFVTRMSSTLRKHELILADVQEKQLRNESVVAIGSLAAGYAHELSSPLTTMAVVVTELQQEHADKPGLRESLLLVRQQIEVAKQIISNLTCAAGRRRAESAGAEPLDRFLHSIIEKARALNPGSTIRISFGSGRNAPQIVAEETFRQAVTNLIDNAVRVSPDLVEVSADWSGTELVVVVDDCGPGFPPQVLERIGKVVQTTREAEGGMGLGLLLTTVTLGLLGGVLIIKNKPQGGARAEIRLPLRAICFEGSNAATDRTDGSS